MRVKRTSPRAVAIIPRRSATALRQLGVRCRDAGKIVKREIYKSVYIYRGTPRERARVETRPEYRASQKPSFRIRRECRSLALALAWCQIRGLLSVPARDRSSDRKFEFRRRGEVHSEPSEGRKVHSSHLHTASQLLTRKILSCSLERISFPSS